MTITFPKVEIIEQHLRLQGYKKCQTIERDARIYITGALEESGVGVIVSYSPRAARIVNVEAYQLHTSAPVKVSRTELGWSFYKPVYNHLYEMSWVKEELLFGVA